MGPTRGARDERAWEPRAKLALVLRLAALLIPFGVAVVAIRVVGPFLYRPPGTPGLLVWIAQAVIVGALVTRSVDVVTRRLLPLAALLNLSLVFPDHAPSRFGVALRAGTIRRLRERTAELTELGTDVNTAAGRAIELVLALGRHDRLTRGHTERVRAYADLIGVELGLDANDRNLLSWGVILHDVGKMAVPPEILNKPGRPTDEEWAILAGHPAAGARMLEPLAPWLGDWGRAAEDHHERWDGSGYPNRLAGTEISLAGRIAAVADAFDVITSKRSYKAAMTNAAARRELVRCAGTQFDPAVVRAFLAVSLGRRRAAGGGAWLGDAQLWGTASTTGGGAVAATAAASVGVVLGTGAVAGATPSVDRHAGRLSQIEVAAADLAEPSRPSTSFATPGESAPSAGPGADDAAATPTASTTIPVTPTTVPPTTVPPTTVPPTTVTATTVPPTTLPPTTLPPTTLPPTTLPPTTLPPTTLPPTTLPPTTLDDAVDDVVEPVVDGVGDVVEPVVDGVGDVVEPVVDGASGAVDTTLDEPVDGGGLLFGSR